MNREVVLANLRAAGYETMSAEDGEQAWHTLDANPEQFDVILLDRRMPRMDGMELLGRIKADDRLNHIPVIMQTAYAAPEDVIAGIQAGVYYYLAKPLDRRLLLSVTAAAIDEHHRFLRLREDLAKRSTAMSLMEHGVFHFRTLAEAETLAVALARACPRSQHLVVGLSEIFTNAVEHGNLGITFEEKARLLADQRWQQRIAALQDAPEHRDKVVTVTYRRLPDEVRITVRDEGLGFDWRRYMDLDLSRAFAVHGRGIAMARKLAFDSLEYLDPGNEVVCVVKGRTNAPCAPARPPADGVAATVDTGDVTATPSAAMGAEELALARRMQAELMPTPEHLEWMYSRYGVNITGFFETSAALGGDVWGMDGLGDRRFRLWLADLSGHGVTAALNAFRLHTLMQHLEAPRDRPGEFLAEVNQRLVGLLPRGQYATLLYGVVDILSGEFTYAAAAAPRPVVVLPDGRAIEGDGSGLPLGVSRTATYGERRMELPRGAALVLASDALAELPSEDGVRLGPKGVSDLLRTVMTERRGKVDVDWLLAPFLSRVRRPLTDDLTAVCCLRPPPI